MPITIKGNAQLVIKKLQAVPASIDKALATGLSRGLLYAASVAQRQFLSGPRPAVLDVRTTRLRNSIATEVEPSGPTIIGRMGSNVSYAAFHEFGFHGLVNVRAHTRIPAFHSVSTGKQIDIRRSLHDDKGNFVGYKESNQGAFYRLGRKMRVQLAFNVVQVRAHSRKIDYAGRPYIRPALEASLPTITTEINRELKAV